jgi:hypothetical protein
VARKKTILTSRSSDRLNHLLHFPGQPISAWQLNASTGELCGFAVLNVIPQHGGRVQLGKIVDCLLARNDERLWHDAILALVRELKNQGADIAQTFASTRWMTAALQQSGFTSRFALEFSVRDRQELIPTGVPFHLMPIEADYAYT